MKRHPSLAHLSRDHHGALLLARLIQKNAPAYKGLPADTTGKVKYALKFYKAELIKHFDAEEKALKLTMGVNDQLDLMVQTIFEEHRQLHSMFQSIKDHADVITHLDETGKVLERHIRKEERELFPLIEESCGEPLMGEIDKLLTA